MSKNIKIGLVILLGVVGIGILGDLQVNTEPKEAPVIETIDGEEFDIEGYDGKNLMLFFYETGCSYCIQAIPEVEALDKEALDIEVVMVNMTHVENSVDDVEKVREELNMKNTIVLDKTGYLTTAFKITATPTQVFLSKDGLGLGQLPGLLKKDELLDLINDVFKED